MLPKRKFTFKNKVTKRNPENAQKPENAVLKKNDNHTVTQYSNGNYLAPGFQFKEGMVLVKDLDASKDGDFVLLDLVNYRVYLQGQLRALFIHRLKGCQVFEGHFRGSVLIENMEDVEIETDSLSSCEDANVANENSHAEGEPSLRWRCRSLWKAMKHGW